ncbi:MAG: HAD-IC family P-type ATPase, partial [Bacilli bacterium]
SQTHHPIAQSVVTFLEEYKQSVAFDEVKEVAGHGVTGVFGQHTILVGNEKLMHSHDVDLSAYSVEIEAQSGNSFVFAAVNNKLVAWFSIADRMKQSSQIALSHLRKMGIKTIMATGDNKATAEKIAAEAGIDEVYAEVLPAQKAEIVNKLKESKHVVAMVGDGINDAPALAVADVGIAMGTGSDVAIETAPITIVGGDLRLLEKSIVLSQKTMRNIRQNFFWATVYNSIGIPIAALGLLEPWIAGAAMAFSSVSVVLNSLRLRNIKF